MFDLSQRYDDIPAHSRVKSLYVASDELSLLYS